MVNVTSCRKWLRRNSTERLIKNTEGVLGLVALLSILGMMIDPSAATDGLFSAATWVMLGIWVALMLVLELARRA